MSNLKCFAVPGEDQIIDTLRPDGTSHFAGETLEEVRLRYPGAEITDMAAFCAAKAARQDAEPREWTETTEERYDEMLDVLPPAAWTQGAFLVGEAWDHNGAGKPRFQCFKHEGAKYYSLSGPISHAQFCNLFGQTSNDYVS